MARIVHHEREICIVSAHEGIVWPLFLARLPGDETLLISGAAHPDYQLRRWDVTTGEVLWETRDGELYYGCFGLALSLGDGKQILAVATENGVQRWDASTGSPLPDTPDLTPGTISSVDSCAMGDGYVMLVGAGNDHLVYRWDAITGTALGAPLSGHGSSVKCVKADRVPGRGLLIASAGDDGTVRLWNGDSGENLRTFAVGGEVMDIDLFVPRAGIPVLTCADIDGVLYRWNAVSGEPLGQPIDTGDRVGSLTSVAVAGEPRLLVSSESGIVRQWHATTGRILDDSIHGISVTALACPDGSIILATGLADGDIHIRTLS
jgi:WD40 repeat protein